MEERWNATNLQGKRSPSLVTSLQGRRAKFQEEARSRSHRKRRCTEKRFEEKETCSERVRASEQPSPQQQETEPPGGKKEQSGALTEQVPAPPPAAPMEVEEETARAPRARSEAVAEEED